MGISIKQKRKDWAVSIFDYVKTHERYEDMSKREAVLEALILLCEDIGVAQGYLQAIGVPYDLYEPESTPLMTPELKAVIDALHKKTYWNDQDGRIGLVKAWINYKLSLDAVISEPHPDIKYGEHKWGAFA